MIELCVNCQADPEPYNAKNCRRLECGLTLLLSGPERFGRKYKAQLEDWLTPELMYHVYTGEDDEYELGRISKLDHALQSSLLTKAEREWPARLEAIAEINRKEKLESKKAVKQFVLGFDQ